MTTTRYSNKHLVEINFGFQFPEETVEWDGAFFGEYYAKIKESGFDKKEERKGLQIVFSADPKDGTAPIATSQIEDQFLFRNNNGYAIMLGKQKISFHCLKDYPGWDDFFEKTVSPYYELYRGMGLGNGKRTSNMVYLNNFSKPLDHDLSEYFTVISRQNDLDSEITTSIRSTYQGNRNILISNLNTLTQEGSRKITLECGSVFNEEAVMNSPKWQEQAALTHAPILDFFEKITTNKLRQEL